MGERVVVGAFPDAASAEAAAALLRLHDIHPDLDPSDALGAALSGGVRLVVPEHEARRVQWILANSELSDSEYLFLTTGELRTAEEARSELLRQRSPHLILTVVACFIILGFFVAVGLAAWRAA